MNKKVVKLINEAKYKDHKSKIFEFLTNVHKSAKDCVGGKRVFINRYDWMEFEKFFNELKDEKDTTPL